MGALQCKENPPPQKVEPSPIHELNKLYPIPNACTAKDKIDDLKKYMPDGEEYEWVGIHPDFIDAKFTGEGSVKPQCYYCSTKPGIACIPLPTGAPPAPAGPGVCPMKLPGYKGYFKKVAPSFVPSTDGTVTDGTDGAGTNGSVTDSNGKSNMILYGGIGSLGLLLSISCTIFFIIITFIIMRNKGKKSAK